jgi:hypothetical protein
MTDFLVTLHGIIRWLILVAALVALYALFAARREGGWTALARNSSQAYAILLSLQVVVGVTIWILQKRWDGTEPFLSWIHPAAMLVAIGLAHGMLGRARRSVDEMQKNRFALIGVVGSLVVLVLAIPWFAK